MRAAIAMGSLAGAVCLGAGARADVGRFKTEPVYFRFVAELEFEKAPLTIDIVVACQQHRTQSRALGGTSETLGMSAYLFAVPLPGGHAVTVRTVGARGIPDPCSGATTANGRVPKDWLPLVVWYDRADDLSHGLGYVNQDAYANPIARLGFRGARVEAATAQDFDRFLQTGPKSLLPADLSGSMSGTNNLFLGPDVPVTAEYLAHPEKAWRYAGPPTCRGVRRIRLPQALRDTVRALWPADRPERWQPPRAVEYDLKIKAVNDPKGPRLESYDRDRRSAGPASDDTVFPVLSNEALRGLGQDPQRAEAFSHDALVDEMPSLRGFVYCDSDAPPALVEALLKRPPERFAMEGRRTCRLGAMPVRVRSWGCSGSWIVFERDDHAFFNYTP